MSSADRSIETLDLIGGTPALDFANTINSRRAPVHDYLHSAIDVIAWAARAGLVTEAERSGLEHQARMHPDIAAGIQRDARVQREAIYRTFSARAARGAPAENDIRLVTTAYATAVGRARFTLGAAGDLRPSWQLATQLAELLDPIAYAAGQLLLNGLEDAVGECPNCGWLFLDRSRNGSRRWCDMRTCGSRDKMRRCRQRRK